jgi:hypothetical protein
MHLVLFIVVVFGCVAALIIPCKELWSTICLKLFGLLGLAWLVISAHQRGHHHAYYTYFAGVAGGAAVGIFICLALARQFGPKRQSSSSTKS